MQQRLHILQINTDLIYSSALKKNLNRKFDIPISFAFSLFF